MIRRYPDHGSRNPNGSWSRGRNSAAQGRFRRALIARDGLRCARCGTETGPFDAHHDTPTDGRLLCNDCHCVVDPHARPR